LIHRLLPDHASANARYCMFVTDRDESEGQSL
jgi:hypothetical protein